MTEKPTWCSAHECYLKPCPKCKKDCWQYLYDNDCSDWEESVYKCKSCGYHAYIELPD